MEIAAQIGDSFFLADDLLDIPNEEIVAPMAESSHQSTGATASLDETLRFNSWAGKSSLFDICLPCEELEELEWLSNFVEESFSSAAMDATMVKAVKESSNPTSVLSPKHGGLSLSKEVIIVPGKARSKRARQGGVCFWNTRILNDDAAALVDCASTFSHDMEAMDSSGLEQESFTDACSPLKKKAKSSHGSKVKNSQELWQGRRCLHCGIQKTPQWRAGPMGSKTLCNACGVRFKSGRLLPEYRPAASPTFVESIHSNSHRKVLEMRRQKECEEMQEGKVAMEESAETEDEKKREEEEERGHDGAFIK